MFRKLVTLETIAILIGFILIFVGFIIFLSKYVLVSKNSTSREVKIVTDNDFSRISFVYTIITFIALFIGFYLYGSIIVVGRLPSYEDSITGKEMLQQIAPYTNITKNFALTGFILFSICFLLSILFLMSNFIKKKRRSSDTKNFKSKSGKKFFLSFSKNLFVYVILIFWFLFTLVPIYLTMKVSVSNITEIISGKNPSSVATIFHNFFINYSSVLFAVSENESAFASALTNSIKIGVGASLISIIISLPASYTVPALSDGVCDIRTEAGSEAGDVIKDVFADGSSQIQVEASVSGSDLYMYVTSLGFTYDRGING